MISLSHGILIEISFYLYCLTELPHKITHLEMESLSLTSCEQGTIVEWQNKIFLILIQTQEFLIKFCLLIFPAISNIVYFLLNI